MAFDVTPIQILLVEDDPGHARLIQAALQETPVATRVTVVGDGDQATAYVRGEAPFRDAARPDLVLLDLNLPRRCGLEVLQDIKRDDRARNIPVIVMTASTDERDVLAAYQRHANAYVVKPAGADQFAHVMRVLGRFWLTVVSLPGRVGG